MFWKLYARVQLSRIQSKLYGLYCPYDIHYMWDMASTCNGTLHCICTRTSHFMGVGAWLGSNTEIGDLMIRLGTVGRSPTESHDCMNEKLVSSNSKKG